MSTLQQFVNSLSTDQQFKLALQLAKLALPVWDAYAKKHSLKYHDSIVGLKHIVDQNILIDTINEVECFLTTDENERHNLHDAKLAKRLEQFNDPIVALQDWDWQLPREVEKVFYAVYNLLDAAFEYNMSPSDDDEIYVSINQAIDALETAGIMTTLEIQGILKEYHAIG
jgi:hypothetical protein